MHAHALFCSIVIGTNACTIMLESNNVNLRLAVMHAIYCICNETSDEVDLGKETFDTEWVAKVRQ